jgi:hypothetical protein
MNIARILLAFLILKISFSAEILFVEPVMNEGGRGLRAVEKTEVDGKRVFVFNQVEKGTEHDRIGSLIQSSSLIQYVLQLRDQARTTVIDVDGKTRNADKPGQELFVMLSDVFGQRGPSMASGFRMVEKDSGLRSDSIMFLSTLKLRSGLITIDDFLIQKYFGALFAHELFHGITGDLYGDTMFEMKARSYSNNGHAADRVTDEFLAFIEGTAEAMEIAVAEMFPAEVSSVLEPSDQSDAVKDFMAGFKRNRLKIAKYNKFVFSANGKELDGEHDNADVLLKTEGVIASLFYRLMFKSNVENPFSKIFFTMANHRPLTFYAFLESFVKDHPEDRESVLRQFLESTHYVTVSKDAAALYKKYYLAKKSWKQNSANSTEYASVASMWKSFREEYYEDVLANRKSVFAAIPFPYMVADEFMFYEVDLNSSPIGDVSSFFESYLYDSVGEMLCTKLVASIGEMRKSGNYILNMDSIEFPEEVELKLEEFHKLYVDETEKQVTEKTNRMAEGIYSGFVDVPTSFFSFIHFQ